jgi:AcrR family transcriptional regulator
MAPGTREALVDTAARFLGKGGVEAVALREAGGQVGVSHNAPYLHSAGKEALLAAIAAGGWGKASPDDPVEDLFDHLRAAAQRDVNR